MKIVALEFTLALIVFHLVEYILLRIDSGLNVQYSDLHPSSKDYLCLYFLLSEPVVGLINRDW